LDASDIPSPPPSSPALPPPGAPRSGNLASLFRGGSDQGMDTVEILNVLRRRLRLILACIAIITAISAAVVLQLTPRYTAESSILLDARKTQVTDLTAVLSGLPADTTVLHGEMEVIRSPPIAEQVVKKLDLTTVAEFNPRLRPPSMFAPLREAVDGMLAQVEPLLGVKQAKPEADPDPAQTVQLAAVRTLQGKIDVTNDGRSYVLKLHIESENPKLAAAIANAYVDAYLQAQLGAKFDAIRRANDWLNDHLTDLRKQVAAADQAVQTFRAAHNLTEAKGETVTTQQLSELNSQLILAAADRAQKESSLHQIQDQLKAGGVDAAVQVLASPLIQQLRKQETDLLQQDAQLATKYKPAHPAMINIKAQERDLEQKIQDEINKVVRSLAGEVTASRAREISLRDSLQQLEKSSSVQGDAGVQLRELERQADSNKMLYENFLNRFKQTSTQEDMQEPDARIVSAAMVPTGPSYPRTKILIGVAFLGSVLIGILAAFGVERLDNGFRTAHQVEKIAHVTALGMAPALKSRDLPYDIVVKTPLAPYSEAIRTIRTALRYSDIDNPPKVILVTSSLPQEGKSVTSLSLARSVASAGGRSLLIDCDLRRPAIAKALKSEGTTGLLSLFEPGMDIRKVIQVDPSSGMHFITTTTGTTNPQDLLGSQHLRKIIDSLRPQYDLIVLDTPPILGVSDAFILSHIADTTVFLIRWGFTPRQVVVGALNSFRLTGGHLAGIVLTRVDFRQHATYGHGDAGYFYGHYGSYYGGYDAPYSER
jgi:succinoglycan biosynthesis transport protein ExoP